MKKYNIGFIGAGKMASAIIKGLLKTGFNSENIIATQAEKEGLEEKSKSLGINVILDNKTLALKSDVIFIAVKPSQVAGVLEEISSCVSSEKLIVSIAAGVNLEKLGTKLPENSRIIRVMPNTPTLVGEGMSAIIGNNNATENDIEYIKALFETLGKCIVIDVEQQMDVVTAISGSGPAFFYKVINDIARAGEKLGLDYEKSLLLSIQTALGSAKMALNRNISMEQLIANVATKGGCTKVGVDAMEANNIDKTLFEVIRATTQKATELGK